MKCSAKIWEYPCEIEWDSSGDYDVLKITVRSFTKFYSIGTTDRTYVERQLNIKRI